MVILYYVLTTRLTGLVNYRTVLARRVDEEQLGAAPEQEWEVHRVITWACSCIHSMHSPVLLRMGYPGLGVSGADLHLCIEIPDPGRRALRYS